MVMPLVYCPGEYSRQLLPTVSGHPSTPGATVVGAGFRASPVVVGGEINANGSGTAAPGETHCWCVEQKEGSVPSPAGHFGLVKPPVDAVGPPKTVRVPPQ